MMPELSRHSTEGNVRHLSEVIMLNEINSVECEKLLLIMFPEMVQGHTFYYENKKRTSERSTKIFEKTSYSL